MDVVADRRAVGSRPVVAGDWHPLAQAGGDLEDQWDHVALRAVRLAEIAVGMSARRVEVAQRDRAQTVGGVTRRQGPLEPRLRLAVDAERADLIRLRNRHALGLA